MGINFINNIKDVIFFQFYMIFYVLFLTITFTLTRISVIFWNTTMYEDYIICADIHIKRLFIYKNTI